MAALGVIVVIATAVDQPVKPAMARVSLALVGLKKKKKKSYEFERAPSKGKSLLWSPRPSRVRRRVAGKCNVRRQAGTRMRNDQKKIFLSGRKRKQEIPGFLNTPAKYLWTLLHATFAAEVNNDGVPQGMNSVQWWCMTLLQTLKPPPQANKVGNRWIDAGGEKRKEEMNENEEFSQHAVESFQHWG